MNTEVTQGRRPGRPMFLNLPGTREAVRKYVLMDLPANKVALHCNIGDTSAREVISNLGFRRMLVTPAERAMVMRSRAAVQKEVV